MLTIQWDVDSLDSLGAGAARIFSRVTTLARGGSIVLMHDGEGPHRASLVALPRILRNLRSRGYRLVTVSRLLRLRSR